MSQDAAQTSAAGSDDRDAVTLGQLAHHTPTDETVRAQYQDSLSHG